VTIPRNNIIGAHIGAEVRRELRRVDLMKQVGIAIHRSAPPGATLLLSCFSQINPVGEEPRPAVSEETLRGVLGDAGWDIESLEPATHGACHGARRTRRHASEMAFWYLRAQRR
jgi:hypothetical protein